PRPLAAKLRVIKPKAGWPRGTSGISLENSGPSMYPSQSTSPAFSAMRKKPSQRVRVPNSRTITSTDSRAMSNRLCTRAANTVGSPPSNQRASAASAAIRKKPSHRPLSISNSISSATRRASYQAAEEHKRSAAAVQPLFYAIGTVEQAHPRKCEMKNTTAVVTEGAAEGAWQVPGGEVTLKHVPVKGGR